MTNNQRRKSARSREMMLVDRVGGLKAFVKLALETPEVVSAVSQELLARGFLNEALARGKSTRRAGDFYSSREWAAARYAALVKHGGKCQCCGATAADGAVMHVDHIKPRSKFPELATELSNLQVLCDLCNIAKSNIDQSDWARIMPDQASDYMVYAEEERRIFRLVRDIGAG